MSELGRDLRAVAEVLDAAEVVRNARLSVKATLNARDRDILDRLNVAVDALLDRRGGR